jgi:cytochrome b pre-mRNA-processing protein 3
MALLGFDLFGAFRRRSTERSGYALYNGAVRAARDPYYYNQLTVPDTLDGRFDMVGLFAFLLIRRLTQADVMAARPGIGQAVFDAMFNDMDVNLREMGVGDLSVGKKVRAMWEAFHGRSSAYSDAMQQGPEALAEALERNVWRGEQAPLPAANLARLAYAQDAHLASLTFADIDGGAALFLPPERVFA